MPCATRAKCQALPAAQCVLTSQVESCVDAASPGICDVSCVIDADCAIVSALHRCVRGVCRAGSLDSGDAGGASGASGAPSSGADAGASACVRGSVSANQVLVIGDSFFASSHQITAYLEAQARSAGVVSAGERYRDRSSLLANGLALGGTGIADQYASGVAEAEARVVLMDGGGADALLGSCDPADASCPIVAAAAAAAQDLLAKMAADHVQHVVYVFYPDPGDANVRARVDALRPLIQSACESAALPCHWLDLRAVFAGHYAEYIQADQLNPTDAGSQASAQAIWDVMTQSCIAQ
ncbi:MAG: SGNH/GDSL hydrolase family protein [Myxococcales bacterium]